MRPADGHTGWLTRWLRPLPPERQVPALPAVHVHEWRYDEELYGWRCRCSIVRLRPWPMRDRPGGG